MIVKVKHPTWPNHTFRFRVTSFRAFWWVCAAVWHDGNRNRQDECLEKVMEHSAHWVAVPRKALEEAPR